MQGWDSRDSVRVKPIFEDFVTLLGRERVEAGAGKMNRVACADEVNEAIRIIFDFVPRINGVYLPDDGGLAASAI